MGILNKHSVNGQSVAYFDATECLDIIAGLSIRNNSFVVW